jgi:hypothetical protein
MLMATGLRWWDSDLPEDTHSPAPLLAEGERSPGSRVTTQAVRVRPPDAAAAVAPPAHGPGARLDYWLAGVPVVAVTVWVASFWGVNPRSMGDLGLVSLFSPLTVAALVVLCLGVLLALHWNVAEWLLALHMVTFLALIHGTPALLYGTLRYSWSYKHVGIVDYILRAGSVDPEISVGGIYHNWPGFFAGSAVLTDAAGAAEALGIATWAPLAFNLINLVVLRYLFRGLTRNNRLVWLAVWIFFIITWVGQDYFAPQAMAYALYLACIGLLVRRSVTKSTIAAFVVMVSAVAASHQITPIMLFIAVTALVLLRRTPGWYLPVITAAVTAAWGLVVARSYTIPGLEEIVTEFGQPVANANETLDKAIVANGSQLIVVWGGRAVVVVATAVALVGAWRSWRARGLGVTAVLLMALPAGLVLVTGFGGEVLFRAFLFAAPFIAFLAAAACLPRDGRGMPLKNLLLTTLLTAVLLPGFLVSYYGKEQQNYFTAAEVEAVAWIDDHARPDSLLVEGSRNYPTQFRNYERFVYVPIDREPEESYAAVLFDPADRLEDWLTDPRYSDAYVLITRSQKIAVDTQRTMPPGSLDRVETALRRSPAFRVAYANSDATVFVLADPEGTR